MDDSDTLPFNIFVHWETLLSWLGQCVVKGLARQFSQQHPCRLCWSVSLSCSGLDFWPKYLPFSLSSSSEVIPRHSSVFPSVVGWQFQSSNEWKVNAISTLNNTNSWAVCLHYLVEQSYKFMHGLAAKWACMFKTVDGKMNWLNTPPPPPPPTPQHLSMPSSLYSYSKQF